VKKGIRHILEQSHVTRSDNVSTSHLFNVGTQLFSASGLMHGIVGLVCDVMFKHTQ